ncbi:SDR family NAD(P)-dependent oxidoreductase [Nocardia fluminea]|uniref:Citronellol/citronellal dehydrogenase n=1 Tax=Nocardia fluminea TaxID=134984 RepID=A0A2N3VKH7_9NOCA|nr:SDR family NAD(P)-dependent oxidoreductase [Nocardia fluminea]PKV82118.1 citronellol/citronellal dehydrogenase [Nocardia fluminea]
MNKPLKGHTVLMSGGTRGTGLAIARAIARQGANIALLADAHDGLHSSGAGPVDPAAGVDTAAAVVEAAGGQALALVCDVRDADRLREAVDVTVDRFGGIDIVITDAEAIDGPDTEHSRLSFEQRQQIQLRGAYLTIRAAIAHLRKSRNPHILSLSPPLSPAEKRVGDRSPSKLAEYGMTLLMLGFASELREDGIGVNCLWPHTAAAAPRTRSAVEEAAEAAIMAAAVGLVLSGRAATTTGNTYLDVEVLAEYGITDLSRYTREAAPSLDVAWPPSGLTAPGAQRFSAE